MNEIDIGEMRVEGGKSVGSCGAGERDGCWGRKEYGFGGWDFVIGLVCGGWVEWC